VTLIDGNLPLSGRSNLTLKIIAPDSIEVISADGRAWPSVVFDDRSFVKDQILTIANADTNELVRLEFAATVSRESLRNALWPISSFPKRRVDAIVDSFLAFRNIRNLSAGAAEAFSVLISDLDPTFVLACYSVLERSSDFQHIFAALTTLFAARSRSLQLVKLLAFVDLAGTRDPNQIFRGNSKAMMSLSLYLVRVALPIRTSICHGISALVHEALVECVFTLLEKEFEKVASLVRALVYRPIGALFIFRFLIPSLTMIAFNQKTAVQDQQIIKFATVLTRAATLTGSDRFIVENAKRIGEFYDRFIVE
jgi:hypothetical protein